MVHDTLPIIKTRSYLKKPQLPYLRLPKIKNIKKNDIVVFNWPADTVRQFFKKEKGVKKPIDNDELEDAVWLSREDLNRVFVGKSPQRIWIPPAMAIAHQLIVHWMHN